MNQLALDLLIQAGLSGHKQVRLFLHSLDGGDCALGVLHIALHHGIREEALACSISRTSKECRRHFERMFEITLDERARIIDLNDQCGLDFIGIARKMEHTPEARVVKRAPGGTGNVGS